VRLLHQPVIENLPVLFKEGFFSAFFVCVFSNSKSIFQLVKIMLKEFSLPLEMKF